MKKFELSEEELELLSNSLRIALDTYSSYKEPTELRALKWKIDIVLYEMSQEEGDS